MPPKRRAPDAPSGAAIIDSDSDNEKKPKKAKLTHKSEDLDDKMEIEEGTTDPSKPLCCYTMLGKPCYRKDSLHLNEYRHKKIATKLSDSKPTTVTTSTTSKKKSDDSDDEKKKVATSKSDGKSKVAVVNDSDSDSDSEQASRIESYKSIMRCAITKGSISPEEIKMLEQLKVDNKITKKEHTQVLQQFGWSDDEYKKGKKEEDDADLAEERAILKTGKPEFKIITILGNKKLSAEEENVYNRASMLFYNTMAKAQGEFEVAEVHVIVNTENREKFKKKKKEHELKGTEANEEWVFHGTSKDSINAIAKTGFLHPDKFKSASTIKVLDTGFFGKGIYFSYYSDYAMWYSNARGSNQLMLCSILRGKCFQCPKRMDGQKCKPGYDSHYSPKGSEIVVFDPDAILPRYIITFKPKATSSYKFGATFAK